MLRIKSQDGFTLTEILVATFIMALGFLSLAEMESLSLRQKQRAELGTIATNVIQFISDRDMAEVRRRYLLNSVAYLAAQAGGAPSLAYCNGSSTSVCNACPCDPLQAVTPNPTDGTTESTCVVIDSQNFDPKSLKFRTTQTQCKADARNNPNVDLTLVKRATTTQATDPASGLPIVTVSITYAVKTPTQFAADTNLTKVGISDTLASQAYQITADVVSYADFIAGWNTVRIPHVP